MTREQRLREFEELMKKAFSLGQTYWQQADSDSFKQQDKSEGTRQAFLELITTFGEAILNEDSEGWLPIESAPKTTKHILLHGDGAGIVDCSYVGSWDETDNKWRLLGGFNSWLEPTHWQPLPDAPNRPADGSEK